MYVERLAKVSGEFKIIDDFAFTGFFSQKETEYDEESIYYSSFIDYFLAVRSTSFRKNKIVWVFDSDESGIKGYCYSLPRNKILYVPKRYKDSKKLSKYVSDVNDFVVCFDSSYESYYTDDFNHPITTKSKFITSEDWIKGKFGFEFSSNSDLNLEQVKELMNSVDPESIRLAKTLINISKFTQFEKRILLGEIRPSDISDKNYKKLDMRIKEYCKQIVIDNIKFSYQKQIKRFDIKIR